MIILGCPIELILDKDKLGTRWLYWIAAMIPFVYIVHALLVGLFSATESEQNPVVRSPIKFAQKATVVSWCTYPVVYVFPMLGISGGNVVVPIQLGYSCSDIISKCGVGLLITPSPWPSLLLSAQATKKLLCAAPRENKSGCQEHRSNISPTMKKPW